MKIKIKNILFSSIIAIGLIGCGSSGSNSSSNDTASDKIKWSYNVGSDTYIYYSSVALSTDNKTLYFGTSKKIRSASSGNDKLIALNKDGTLKWKYDLTDGEEVRSSPVVSNGKILFIADKRTGEFTKEYTDLFCIYDNNGTLAWTNRISDNTNMSSVGKTVVTVQNNKVFTVMKNIFVYDLNNGTELYKSADIQTNDVYINPIINNNKMIFVLNDQLYSVNTSDYNTSTIDLSNILSGTQVLSTMAVDSSDNIYFGTDNGKIISLDNQYNQRWQYSLEDNSYVRSSPAIDESHGLLYIGTKNDNKSKFLALNINDGSLSWVNDINRDIYSSPTIGNNGNIYFGSESKYVYSLDYTGKIIWSVSVGQDITWPSPTIDNDGIIYIGGMGDGNGNGELYAIQTDSSGLSTENWPTIHKNSQNNAVK